jgi:hypothetical protein
MGKPKPFSRPSISLGGGEKKEWREVNVYSLKPGDIVRGFGAVEQVSDYGDGVVIIWRNETRSYLSPGDVVTAFVTV